MRDISKRVGTYLTRSRLGASLACGSRCSARDDRCARSPTQVRRPELQGAAPGELGGGTVVDVALLVDEGVLGVVAEHVRSRPGGLQGGLEGVDGRRRAP